MRWTILLALSFVSLMFVLPANASACRSTPSTTTKDGCIIKLGSDYSPFVNETTIDDGLYEAKERCHLSDFDMSVIKGYSMNGYSVMEQDSQEYAAFLKEARTANAGRPNDCLVYMAVSHRGRWTGFIDTALRYIPEKGVCLPLETVTGCGGGSTGLPPKRIWDDLPGTTTYAGYLVLAVIAAVVIVSIVTRRK